MQRYFVEEQEKWRELIDKIPYIAFPRGWKVSIIPPFAGAVARFHVKVPGQKGVKSIYLDWYDALGCYGSPYWEVHPYRGDVGRCDVDDIRKLLRMIGDKRP